MKFEGKKDGINTIREDCEGGGYFEMKEMKKYDMIDGSDYQ